jgi:hypothetical protein
VVTAPTPGQLPVLAEASFALEAGTVKAMERRRFRDRTEAGHLDETRAVEPLELTSERERGELPETYSWAL